MKEFDILIASEDNRLYYYSSRILEKEGIRYLGVQPSHEALRGKTAKVILTTLAELDEVTRLCNSRNVLAIPEPKKFSEELPQILLILKCSKKPLRSLIIGLDPGEKIGIAVFADGMLLLAETVPFRPLNRAVVRIEKLIEDFPAFRTIVRVGNSPKHISIGLTRSLMKQFKKKPQLRNVLVEWVDETKTTPKKEKKSLVNQAAAKSIALRRGHRLEKIPPQKNLSKKDIKRIQKISREKTLGGITISRSLARKVASGKISMEEAINRQKGVQ